MLTLSPQQVDRAEEYIRGCCRPLERARFRFLFRKGDATAVLRELKEFQNPDGGFGHGLESDFLMPDSSPLASSVAFQLLDEIADPDEEMLRRAIRYLEGSFLPELGGWLAVSSAVNNYPHAVWWHWDEAKGRTVIDEHWGNPSAEIVGYLNKYRKYVSRLDVDELTERAISHWEHKTDFPSEHEVYCYIRLHEHLSARAAKRLEGKLAEATKKLVALDPEVWPTYSPQPLHFASRPNFFLYEVVRVGIEANLDYLINSLRENGVWSPNWTWHQYEDAWPRSKTNWEGVLAIRNLKTLYAYGRIEE